MKNWQKLVEQRKSCAASVFHRALLLLGSGSRCRSACGKGCRLSHGGRLSGSPLVAPKASPSTRQQQTTSMFRKPSVQSSESWSCFQTRTALSGHSSSPLTLRCSFPEPAFRSIVQNVQAGRNRQGTGFMSWITESDNRDLQIQAECFGNLL